MNAAAIRSYLLVLISLLLFSFSKSGAHTNLSSDGRTDTVNNDLVRMDLKGEVKFLTQRIEESNPDIHHTDSTTFEFDRKGNTIKENQQGGITTYRNKYDTKGNLVYKATYLWGDLFFEDAYEYDNKGNLLKSVSEGIRGHKIICKYDQRNKLIERKLYNSANAEKPELTYTYEYDKIGNLISVLHYNDREELVIEETYEYNEKGTKIAETFKNEGAGILITSSFKYDLKGNLIEENMLRSESTVSNKTFKYENYDPKGNWQKKTEYTDNVLVKITERKITYRED